MLDWSEAYLLLGLDLRAAKDAAILGKYEQAAAYARAVASYAMLLERALDDEVKK